MLALGTITQVASLVLNAASTAATVLLYLDTRRDRG